MADYQPKYTTLEQIQLLTKGLFNLGMSQTLGGQSSDPDKVLLIIKQKESFVDAVLAQIYELPLQNDQPIVTEIVEDLVIRQLTGRIPAQSMPGSGQTPFTAGNAEFLLQLLTVGHNIAIPGVPQMPSIPGASTPQPIVLLGERMRTNPPDTLTREVTMLGDRKFTVGKLYKDTGIDFEGGIKPSDRSMGGERPTF